MLAISLSFDALGIGVAYGLKGVKIPLAAKSVILIMSFIIASACEILGQHLLNILPYALIKAIGALILTAVGIYTIFSDPLSYDINKSLSIDLPEAFFLSIVLSADSIGAVIGNAASGGGFNTLPVTISLCQFIFLSVGQKMGYKIIKNKGIYKFLPLLTGCIIIFIAIFRIVER